MIQVDYPSPAGCILPQWLDKGKWWVICCMHYFFTSIWQERVWQDACRWASNTVTGLDTIHSKNFFAWRYFCRWFLKSGILLHPVAWVSPTNHMYPFGKISLIKSFPSVSHFSCKFILMHAPLKTRFLWSVNRKNN